MTCQCNGTGIVIERREGINYHYTCKDCGKFDPKDYWGHQLREIAERRNLDVPVVHSE